MRKLATLTLTAMFALAQSGAFAASRIGTASTVKNRVTGTVAGQLRPGTAVHQREVITSDTGAEAQLIFIDETVFNVGSGATVTLDEFIYNPSRKVGNIVLNVTKGAFRFISGSAEPSSYTIKTPVATIGVRGTIFTGNVLSELFMTLKLLQGQLFICLKPGARIEGTNLADAEPVQRNGEDCYLVDPGTFSVGFGPLEDWQNPGGDTSDPNDGSDDPVDTYKYSTRSPFIEQDTEGFIPNNQIQTQIPELDQ